LAFWDRVVIIIYLTERETWTDDKEKILV
jgi:hypothetical protein